MDAAPFGYRITATGQVLVSRDGRQVATIAGTAAAKLTQRLGEDPELDQLLLAKATGNYKRGNERR